MQLFFWFIKLLLSIKWLSLFSQFKTSLFSQQNLKPQSISVTWAMSFLNKDFVTYTFNIILK